ncbi:MAG: STAS domain-containing protein [Phycisphaerae bacterium]|nr:STAS domain-containing protein [Phycisphaerae bacterium]
MEKTTLGPITVETDASQVRFRFTSPDRMTLEVPVSLEGELSDYVAEHREALTGKRLVIDLGSLPAVSSRQLGMMLTIRKTCQPLGEVELESVSDGVRYLLKLTRMAGYFHMVDPNGA